MASPVVGGIIIGLILIAVGVGLMKLNRIKGAVYCFLLSAAMIVYTVALASGSYVLYVLNGIIVGIVLVAVGSGMLKYSSNHFDQRFKWVWFFNNTGRLLILCGAATPFVLAYVMWTRR